MFHSALGLRRAILSFAEELRSEGHQVHTPDLYEGSVYQEIEEGIAHRDRVGIPTLLELAQKAVEDLPADTVYIGYSLGAALAQSFAQNRRGALGAILMHGVLPPAALGGAWPSAVSVQVHGAELDSWIDLTQAKNIVAEMAASASADLFLYPGSGHLFTDSDSVEFNKESTTLAHSRIREFLSQ